MASKSTCVLLGWSTPVRCRPTPVCPKFQLVLAWLKLPWQRTFRHQLGSLVLMSGFGIKASPKLVLSAGRMVTV